MLNKSKSTLFVAFLALLLGLALSLPAFAAECQEPGAYAKKKVAECGKNLNKLSMDEVKTKLGQGGLILLDCRTEKEFKKGHLPGALNVPRGKVEFLIEKKVNNYDTPLVVYCKSGGRACLTSCTLADMGYTNVSSMKDGFSAWTKAGNPVE